MRMTLNEAVPATQPTAEKLDGCLGFFRVPCLLGACLALAGVSGEMGDIPSVVR
jgi:hypothetical protein